MNEVLVEFELGPAALQYIRERLAEGKTLARYLLEREDLASGSVITCLPPNVPVETLEDFNESKLERDPATFRYRTGSDGSVTRYEPVPNTDPWLASVVQGFLRGGSDRVCILENSSALPGDPWLQSCHLPILIFDDEVYHFVSHKDAENQERILETIRTARSWLFYGVMTLLPKIDAPSLEAGTIDGEFLQACAQKAERVVVGAYDGESHLIWRRGSP